MVLKDLFGGAIVAEMPNTLIDASDFRQIPDNQEVFMYSDCNASIIIEVLERVRENNDGDAVRFHFEALAHNNDAVSSTMKTPFVMHNTRKDQTPSPVILHGSQSIHKFNSIDPDEVDILAALFRVNSGGKTADLVVSANIPKSSEDSVEERVASDFNSLVLSLRIIDYGLFC